MAQVLGPMPPTWEAQMEFLGPDFGLMEPQLLQAFGEQNSEWEIPSALSVCLSVSAFEIKLNRKIKIFLKIPVARCPPQNITVKSLGVWGGQERKGS